MADRSLELRVGLTIFLAALIFIVGLMWFQGFKVGRSSYELHAVFPMVGGVDPGDEVNVNGVERGQVKQVTLRERDVLVTMEIDNGTQVPVDSRIILQTVGIMGERIVTIVLGVSDTLLEAGSNMEGIYDPGMSEALASLGRVMEDMHELSGEIKKVTEILTEGERLRNTLENLASTAEELSTLIEKNAPEIDEGVKSFRVSAVRVDELLSRNTVRLDSMIIKLEEASRELPGLFDRMSEVTETLGSIAKKVESDESALGALLQDRELIEKLRTTITSLNELIADIKANPKKYLKVEIF
jgi:phospholipid/cholesterol/gamma-HCH transport system substrate-binding protein